MCGYACVWGMEYAYVWVTCMFGVHIHTCMIGRAKYTPISKLNVRGKTWT